MRFPQAVILFAALAILPSLAQSQEAVMRSSEERAAHSAEVPILGRIPGFGHLFRSSHERLWFSLTEGFEPMEEEAKPDVRDGAKTLAAGRPPASERRLRDDLARLFPELGNIDIVEEVIVRHRGEERQIARKRGLEIFGPAETLDLVRQHLERWSFLRERLFEIRTHFVTVGQLHLEPFEQLESGATQVALVDENVLRARKAKLQEHGQGEVVTAPRLVVYNRQRANLRVGNNVSYVKDFDIETRGGMTANPIIDVVHEGTTIDLRPELQIDGETISLVVRVRQVTLERPIGTFTTSLGIGQSVTFEVPRLHKSEWDSEELVLRPGVNAIIVAGLHNLVAREGEGVEAVPMELWLEIDHFPAPTDQGEVLASDQGNALVLVRWPESLVSGNPAIEAPGSIEILRADQVVGRARLEGGWRLPLRESEMRWAKVAIYRLLDGEAQAGDGAQKAMK